MFLAQLSIDFDETVINARIVANQTVSGYQTTKTIPECRAGRQIVRLVNQHAADASVLVQHAAQFFQHLIIGELPTASQNNALGRVKQARLDDALKYAVSTDPLVLWVGNMLEL